MLVPGRLIRIDPGRRPMLLVVVDTEEEFDWKLGFDPKATSVTAITKIGRFQEVCDEFGIRPTYVIDYPIASQKEAIDALRGIVESERATLGAHLHPWVNPPIEEEVSARHSYPGNLERDLEARKLRTLVETIERNFGVRTTVYKAGRYGVGPNTSALLEGEGFDVDLSVYPRADLRDDGGPDYTRFGPEPFWFGESRRLLEIPVTAAYVGYLHRAGRHLHRFGLLPHMRWARLPGILSRLGALERLRLTPEGMDARHHRRLTLGLMRRGVRTFTFSFHSPSVDPGHTQYVRDETDLSRFLGTCRAFFEFFLGELNGVAMTPLEMRQALQEAP